MSAGQIYKMLGNESLWETALICHRLLEEAGIQHAVCGGVAICLHGYQRNTIDLDLIIHAEDAQAIQALLIEAGLEWLPETKEFRTTSGIPVQFLYSGSRAGSGSVVRLPRLDEAGAIEMIDSLPVLRLSKMIEAKLACGEGNMRRTHKDFADVVELIMVRGLDSSFSRHLHKSLRKTFKELVQRTKHEPEEE